MRTVRLIILAFFLPMFACASGLVNINTAGLATLETLPHIGATLAQRIIDYRTQNGAFASIEGLQKVSGIGSGSNYADIAPLITVGDASATTDTQQASGTTEAASSTPSQSDTSAPSRSASAYAPPPSDLTVTVAGPQRALVEAPVTFAATVKMKEGTVDSAARVVWSFGDGSSAEGSEASKTFHYAGTYPVTVRATDGAAKASGELVVTVAAAKVRIAAISGDGIIIRNDSDTRLDLSGWRITTIKGIFRIPAGTTVLPESEALFPFSIMNMPITLDAALTYPDGVTAARYSPAAVAASGQSAPALPNGAASGLARAAAAPASAPPVSDSRNVAPALSAATGQAAAGQTEAPVAEAAAGAAPAARSFFRSPWTYGLLGVMITAAGAFVLL